MHMQKKKKQKKGLVGEMASSQPLTSPTTRMSCLLSPTTHSFNSHYSMKEAS